MYGFHSPARMKDNKEQVMPKKKPLTADSRERLVAQLRRTYAEALIVRSFLAGHLKKKKEIRRRWHAVLAEMDRIEELLSEA